MVGGGSGVGGVMVAQGNSLDAPPAAILSRARSRCFYDKLRVWGGTTGGWRWGLACLPYHSLCEPGSDGHAVSRCVCPSSSASTRLEEGAGFRTPAARLFWPDTSSVSSLNLKVVHGDRRLRPAFPLDAGQLTRGLDSSLNKLKSILIMHR